MSSKEQRRLVVEPIGLARSPYLEKMQAPRQPDQEQCAVGRVELYAGHDL